MPQKGQGKIRRSLARKVHSSSSWCHERFFVKLAIVFWSCFITNIQCLKKPIRIIEIKRKEENANILHYTIITASDLTSPNGKRRSNGLNFFLRVSDANGQPAARLADPVWVMRLDLGFDSTPMTGFHGASTGSYHLPATPSAIIHHNDAVESITEMDQSGAFRTKNKDGNSKR